MVQQKQRHGCLTAWLVVMIIVLALSLIVIPLGYLVDPQSMREALPDVPWALPMAVASSLFYLIFTIALFAWKKWAFWGYVVFTIAGVIMGALMGAAMWELVLSLAFIVVLYAVLHIGGKEKKGWSQLE